MLGKYIRCGQIVKCLLFMIFSFACLLWIYLMLSANDEESRIILLNDLLDINLHNLPLPSYKLTKKQYYEQFLGYYLHSYLPPPLELQQILKHPAQHKIESKYPTFHKLGDLLKHWPAKNTNKNLWKTSFAHPTRGKGLYRLNYQNETELKFAFILKQKALPYVLYNIPDLDAAATEVFTLDGLLDRFGHTPRVVEQSRTNEFLYYTLKNPSLIKSRFPNWKPPQKDVAMTFKQFLSEVDRAEHTQKNDVSGDESLFYLIINANEGGRTSWIRSALPMFEPVDSLFMLSSEDYRGINCRFGMKGVIATAHYDGRQNFIAMVRGRKRYVLLPPTECSKLDLYQRGHPSSRHSQLLWSNNRLFARMPELRDALATEVVLSMGEMLFIPSYWFHYIISQDGSVQCNARSGESLPGREEISKCGFTQRKDTDHPDLQDEQEEQEERHKAKYSMIREKLPHENHKKKAKLRRRKPIPNN